MFLVATPPSLLPLVESPLHPIVFNGRPGTCQVARTYWLRIHLHCVLENRGSGTTCTTCLPALSLSRSSWGGSRKRRNKLFQYTFGPSAFHGANGSIFLASPLWDDHWDASIQSHQVTQCTFGKGAFHLPQYNGRRHIVACSVPSTVRAKATQLLTGKSPYCPPKRELANRRRRCSHPAPPRQPTGFWNVKTGEGPLL